MSAQRLITAPGCSQAESNSAAPGVASVTFTERQEGGWTFLRWVPPLWHCATACTALVPVLSDHAARQESAAAAKPLWVVSGPKAVGSLGAVQKSTPSTQGVPAHQRRRSSGNFIVYGTVGGTLRQRQERRPWCLAVILSCLALVLGMLVPRVFMTQRLDQGAAVAEESATGPPLLELGGTQGGAFYPPTWRPTSPFQPSGLALAWWTSGGGLIRRQGTSVTPLQAATSGAPGGVADAGTILVLLAFLSAAFVAAGHIFTLMWARDMGTAGAAATALLSVFLAPSWAFGVVGVTLGVACVSVMAEGNRSLSPAYFPVGYRSMLGFM